MGARSHGVAAPLETAGLAVSGRHSAACCQNLGYPVGASCLGSFADITSYVSSTIILANGGENQGLRSTAFRHLESTDQRKERVELLSQIGLPVLIALTEEAFTARSKPIVMIIHAV